MNTTKTTTTNDTSARTMRVLVDHNRTTPLSSWTCPGCGGYITRREGIALANITDELARARAQEHAAACLALTTTLRTTNAEAVYTVDGFGPFTFSELMRDNDGDPDVREFLDSIAVGKSRIFGGGAVGEQTITRVR